MYYCTSLSRLNWYTSLERTGKDCCDVAFLLHSHRGWWDEYFGRKFFYITDYSGQVQDPAKRERCQLQGKAIIKTFPLLFVRLLKNGSLCFLSLTCSWSWIEEPPECQIYNASPSGQPSIAWPACPLLNLSWTSRIWLRNGRTQLVTLVTG